MLFSILRKVFRSWKRFLTVLTAISIFVCMMTSPAAAYGFSDVSRNDNSVVDYFDAINWASDNGYMVGTSSTTFSPNQYVSRATAICVIWRYAGCPSPPSYTNPFNDVSSSSWYYDAVLWGVAQGIIYGTSSTTFSPNATVTREQLMAFFYRYAASYSEDLYSCDENELNYCLDANQIYYALINAMQWSISNGILVWPTSDYKLYPKAYVQRKELALFVNRYSCNVDGMLLSDRFQFSNYHSNFQSGCIDTSYYMITSTHLARLHNFLHTTQYPELRDSINEKHLESWHGACYGMSLSCILDKLGKIDFNKCLANDCDSIYQIPSLSSYTNYRHILVNDYWNSYFSKAESAIHYYQFSYQIIAFDENILPSNGGFLYQGANLHQGILEFIDSKNHSKLSLFSFFWIQNGTNEVHGHSIVVYGHPICYEGEYRYHVYDPSYPNTSVWLVTNPYSDYIYLTNHTDITIYRAEYLNSFEFTNTIDLDDDYNNAG